MGKGIQHLLIRAVHQGRRSLCGEDSRMATTSDLRTGIIIRWNGKESAVDLVRHHIVDLVLTTLPHEHSQLHEVVNFIRCRDGLFDLHTPIVSASVSSHPPR